MPDVSALEQARLDGIQHFPVHQPMTDSRLTQEGLLLAGLTGTQYRKATLTKLSTDDSALHSDLGKLRVLNSMYRNARVQTPESLRGDSGERDLHECLFYVRA